MDISNPHFEVTLTEETRPAIRALRGQILAACEGQPGDLCIQALMEALVHAVNVTMNETDRAAAFDTIGRLLRKAADD
jgi:hypothetical protein